MQKLLVIGGQLAVVKWGASSFRSELRMRQYRDDNHREDVPPFRVQIELDEPGLCCKINCSFIRIDFACNEICYVSALGLVQGQIVNIKVILWVI